MNVFTELFGWGGANAYGNRDFFRSVEQTYRAITSTLDKPHFPSIEDALGANASNSAHSVAAREVWSWFLDHLDSLLESVRFFRFDQFEMHIRSFWASLTGTHREVVHAPAIAGLMAKGDAIVYDVSVALVLSPSP